MLVQLWLGKIEIENWVTTNLEDKLCYWFSPVMFLYPKNLMSIDR